MFCDISPTWNLVDISVTKRDTLRQIILNKHLSLITSKYILEKHIGCK